MGFVGSFIDGDDECYEYHSCETPEKYMITFLVILTKNGISDWMQQMIDEEEEENRMDEQKTLVKWILFCMI